MPVQAGGCCSNFKTPSVAEAHLSKFDTENMEEWQKAQFNDLWRRLHGAPSDFENYMAWLLVGTVVAYYVWSTQKDGKDSNSEFGRTTPILVGTTTPTHVSSGVRDARLRKLATPEGSYDPQCASSKF